ncbi:protein ROOT INITIATION DEFECTIVE 3-like [Panicum miliaceum]|uniref:Protein ROOT INITIATION DEFECTIVE 3-like n=1 Tax=Panicum miliaceum TaxID=4540 RepID=A0A3L6T443_PANMI|nr:protein ROOT INITIATION DEFECTIVE 3-like [Panicum miliaceum]
MGGNRRAATTPGISRHGKALYRVWYRAKYLTETGRKLLNGQWGWIVCPVIRVLDVDDAGGASSSADLAIYRVSAYVAPVTCVACGRGGCNAAVASASADGTCKVWRLADGAHLRTLALPCAALSLALDPTSSSLYAGCSDGRVHVASLNSPGTNAVTATTSHASESERRHRQRRGGRRGC